MKRFTLFIALIVSLSFVGCATTQTVVSEKVNITEKPPYVGPEIDASVGVEWKW